MNIESMTILQDVRKNWKGESSSSMPSGKSLASPLDRFETNGKKIRYVIHQAEGRTGTPRAWYDDIEFCLAMYLRECLHTNRVAALNLKSPVTEIGAI